MIEIPFPTPYSVIFSPSHITNALPAVKTIITVKYPSTLFIVKKFPLSKPIERPRLSITARRIVTYLVIAVIFLRPSSPSFCISSKAGNAIVRSCIIIDDVIYGVTLSAKIDICVNEPPVNELIKLFASPKDASRYSLIACI